MKNIKQVAIFKYEVGADITRGMKTLFDEDKVTGILVINGCEDPDEILERLGIETIIYYIKEMEPVMNFVHPDQWAFLISLEVHDTTYYVLGTVIGRWLHIASAYEMWSWDAIEAEIARQEKMVYPD